VIVGAGARAASGQACAVLDSQVFAHAAPSLKDLRIFSGKNELPYAITLSEPLQQDSEEARILNLGTREGRVVFDLQMPNRPFTNVTLELAAKDFIATASVFGEASANAAATRTSLGSFTLFDLSSQRLSHSTGIPLPESNFPYLHIELELSPAPGVAADGKALRDPAIVKSANVPPSREAQTVYTTISETTSLVQRGRQSVATFHVPVRVPVERISFAVAPGFKGNFSREVEIKANASRSSQEKAGDPDSAAGSEIDESAPRQETLAGTISRVHATEAGRELTEEQLSVPAAIGSNMQRPAEIEVAIGNGDDQPLPIAAVRLEMRQRRLCFDAGSAGAPLTLDYGDAGLDAPVYDYAKLFQPAASPLAATLGPEALNAEYEARAESRPFTERHPELLWIGLLGVVCILAVTAIKSAKKLH
jgi:hypothetical protein